MIEMTEGEQAIAEGAVLRYREQMKIWNEGQAEAARTEAALDPAGVERAKKCLKEKDRYDEGRWLRYSEMDRVILCIAAYLGLTERDLDRGA